jgi:hypothetical protein
MRVKSLHKQFKYTTVVKSAGLLLLLALLTLQPVRAQEVSVNAKVDSMLIFIGGQIDLTLEVSQPAGTQINFPLLTDTITKSIEIVNRGKLDTSRLDNNRLLIKQVYRITSFDSGVHLIPAIRFELADETARQLLETQPMALKVINPFDEVDPEKGIYDIKQPINTPFLLSELLRYLKYLLLYVVIAAVVILLVLWYKKRKSPLAFLVKEKPIDPPHVIALRELERIREEKLWQKNQVKRYYSEITDVLRQYMETQFEFPAMEQTSDEIITSLKTIDTFEKGTLEPVSKLLELADLVKFAKHTPLPDENDLSLMHALFFVNQTKIEEMKSLEEEKKEMEKKENEKVREQ